MGWRPKNEVVADADGISAWVILTDRSGVEKRRTRIDLEDVDRVLSHGRWCHEKGEGLGYARCGYTKVFLHRLIDGTPDGMETDHVNGDTLDNRKGNLRTVTRALNGQNVVPHGVSRFRGVCWEGSRSKWRATVQRGGETVFCARFDTEKEAAQAAQDARDRLMTHSVEARHPVE